MIKVRGFTLIELMVVVVLVAIGALIATPSLQNMMRNNRAATQANALIMALNLARSEAVKRGMDVSVCARAGTGSGCSTSDKDWRNGWLVFLGKENSEDDAILQVFPALSGQTALSAESALISYAPDGFLDTDTNERALTFKLRVQGCEGSEARQISVNLQGRATVGHQPC